jgi:hypothetical protein
LRSEQLALLHHCFLRMQQFIGLHNQQLVVREELISSFSELIQVQITLLKVSLKRVPFGSEID